MKKRSLTFDELPLGIGEAVELFFREPDATKWDWDDIPISGLIEKIWSCLSKESDFSTFLDYHKYYISKAVENSEWPPEWSKYDPASLMAIVVEGNPKKPWTELCIVDGWHRFHWYVDQHSPEAEIPIVWASKAKPGWWSTIQ